MKKQAFLSILLMLSLGVFVTSCSDDDDDDTPVDTGPELDGRVSYGVTVVPAEGANIAAKTTGGLANAVVVLTQEGESITDTTDADGLASFKGLNPGLVNGVVKSDAYADVFFTANLIDPNSNVGAGATIVNNEASDESEFYAASTIPMLPNTGDDLATITGTATADLDETDNDNEDAVNVRIDANISLSFGGGVTAGSLGLTSYVLDEVNPSAETNAQGEYTITVPPTTGFLNVAVTLSPRDLIGQSIETANGDVTRDLSSGDQQVGDLRPGARNTINFAYQ